MALQLANIEPIGTAHRGIDDAINTAQLFIKFADKIQLVNNTLSKAEISRSYRAFIETMTLFRQNNKK